MKGIGGHDERDILGGGLPDLEDEPPDDWRPDEEFWQECDRRYEEWRDKQMEGRR